VLLLTLTRLALRRVQGVPDTLEGNPDWQRAAAKAGHFLLYAVVPDGRGGVAEDQREKQVLDGDVGAAGERLEGFRQVERADL
ncbi:hypothetical protein VST49_33220, partial [Pseudomonas aeruginosa]